MEMFVMIVLGVSILGLISLFLIKNWEEKHARVFMPGLRLAADGRALELKGFLVWSVLVLRRLGPTLLRITRVILHDLALYLADLSRASERAAHRLADMVSHKHHFERKETKSEFLKQVGEYPIRNLRELPQTPAPVVEVPAEAVVSAPVVSESVPHEAPAAVVPSTEIASAKKSRKPRAKKDKLETQE